MMEFEKALSFNDQVSDIHFNFANLLLDEAEFDRAIEEYEEAWSLDESNRDTYKSLERAYEMRDLIKPELLKYLEKNVRENPENGEMRVFLGRGYVSASHRLINYLEINGLSLLPAQKLLDMAEDEFKVALRINPDDSEASEDLEKL